MGTRTATKRGQALALGLALALAAAGCGYSLRTAKERGLLLEREKIRKIFVASPVNQSIKPGLETLVYSELVRALKEYDQVRWVQDRDQADAVIETIVVQADSTVNTQDAAERMVGEVTDQQLKNILVPTEYSANLGCTFLLKRQNPPKGSPNASQETLWTMTLRRSTPFPASSQAGPAGVTAPLIHASEFDRATADNARKMMADLREVLFSTF